MGDKYVGVIGFGEVGSTFSNTMAKRGAQILVYDELFEQEGGVSALSDRIQHEGVEFTTLPDVLSRSEMILSVVTTQVAEVLAKQIALQLRPQQIYVDLNSTSPLVKKRIGQIIEAVGVDFVEGAILGAVGAMGASVRILMAGEKGEQVAEFLKKLGLNTAFYSDEVGKASTFKMLRSIFSKGLEALMLELMITGRRAGIEGDLWEDVTDFMTENPFDRVVENWIRTHAVAYERRYHEMVQVVETMREIGVEPIMASATELYFKRSCSLEFEKAFGTKPEMWEQVIDFMEKRLSRIS
jgi:3-hydroxyisobutyrate dehydrogenase-like beta-hydroxyacid dehydrogenase